MILRRMTLTERLNAYRERHDLTYQMLALRMAWKGCGLDPSTLFAICTTPTKPIAERTKLKIQRFLASARNGRKLAATHAKEDGR